MHTVAYDRFDAGDVGAAGPLRVGSARSPSSVACSGAMPLHRYADPLGAMNLAVMVDGDELGWHYDQTDFVVSLAIQSSDGGGDFESVQRLRRLPGGGIEERYDEVGEILAGSGGRDRVTTVPMTPGTLMLFEGRWSLHRVTPVAGDDAALRRPVRLRHEAGHDVVGVAQARALRPRA